MFGVGNDLFTSKNHAYLNYVLYICGLFPAVEGISKTALRILTVRGLCPLLLYPHVLSASVRAGMVQPASADWLTGLWTGF